MLERAAIVLVVAAGCASGTAHVSPPTPAVDPNAPLLSFERSACEGDCPAYKIDVEHDGTVRYDGRSCVQTRGRVLAQLSSEKVDALRAAIARADFARLAERCCVCPFDDAPTITITVADPAPKTIENACGSQGRAGIVRELADSIDAIVDAKQWIGTDSDQRRCGP